MNDEEYEREMMRILDRSFKNAIHRPTILAWILRLCIEEFKESSIEEIRDAWGSNPAAHTSGEGRQR